MVRSHLFQEVDIDLNKLEMAVTVENGRLIPHFLHDDEMKQFQNGQQLCVSVVSVKPDKIRTCLQNKSLHKYFSNLANALNSAGHDQRGIMAHIGKGAEIPWSSHSIKDLWKTVQELRNGKDSTTKMTTDEYSREYRIFDNMISRASGGVSVPLPSRDSQSYE